MEEWFYPHSVKDCGVLVTRYFKMFRNGIHTDRNSYFPRGINTKSKYAASGEIHTRLTDSVFRVDNGYLTLPFCRYPKFRKMRIHALRH